MSLVFRINETREGIIHALSESVASKEGGRKKEHNKPKESVSFLHPAEYYEERVLCIIDDWASFQVEVEYVETPEQKDLWKYFRYHTSSIKTHQNIGRNLKFLVREVTTKKYIGIFALGSDLYGYAARDAYIGWTNEARAERLNYVVNIWACVALQPIGFNYNVGKLIASLCFTNEVLDAFVEKYQQRPAAIATFGAYGISAQYERLPYLKRVGETKGYNSNAISDELYENACRLYCEVFDTNQVTKRGGRLDNLKAICRWLSIPDFLIRENGIKRTVYVGFTSPNAQEFLKCGGTFEIPEERTVASVVEWWKDRWAKPRYAHLVDTNRLQATSRVVWTWDPVEKKQYNYNHKHQYDVLPIHEYTLNDEEVQHYRHTELHPGYIAGFLDGDGTIGYSVESRTVYISVTQCDVRPLLALQSIYGGTIRATVSKRSSRERIRYEYNLFKHTEPLLKLMKDYSILKSKRAAYCYAQLFEPDAEKDSYEDIVPKMKQIQTDYLPVEESYYQDRLTNAYIAGLFDAEGYMFLKHKKTYLASIVTITQKSNTSVLKAIKDKYGYGTIQQYRYCIYDKDSKVHLLKILLPNLIVKKEQSELMIQLLTIPAEKIIHYTSEALNHKQYKYREYRMNPDTFTALNMEGKLKAKSGQIPYRVKRTIVKVKQTRCTKGQAMNIQHRTAIAVKAALKRKTVGDGIIDTVREMLKTHKQSDIEKQLNLKRYIVNNIALGKTLKTDEITMEKKHEQTTKKKLRKETMTPEEIKVQSSIHRRKIPLETMVQIMKMASEPFATPMSIYDQLKKDATDSLPYQHTAVKDILVGKTQPYDSEYPLLGIITKETYQQWLADISKLDFTAARKIQMGMKVRSVSATTIMEARLMQEANPKITKKDLANHFNIASSTLRRFLDHPELYYPMDFPVVIQDKTYTYEDYVCLCKKKQEN
jgi:hypothetical protein